MTTGQRIRAAPPIINRFVYLGKPIAQSFLLCPVAMLLSLPNLSPHQWVFKYKIYHLPFWLLYHYCWWGLTLGSAAKAFDALLYLPYTLKYGFFVLFQALAVYLNLYYLIPTYLVKSRFVRYGAYLIGTISLTSLLLVGGYYASAWLTGKPLDELYGTDAEPGRLLRFFNTALPSTLASMTLAMSIYLAKNWLQTRQHQQALETEKLETELKFLRNQFNPHFLFNTINSIFFLIHKNPNQASASLATFSDLLRYQLYECNDAQIPLSKELAYLANFIDLEKLRQNKNIEVVSRIEPENTPSVSIAPFILMPFVENAFKHVSRQSDRLNWISIQVRVEGAQLWFEVANSFTRHTTPEFIPYSGIGLANVQRRLDLLYPARYTLRIQPGVDDYAIRLQLGLTNGVVASVQTFV